MTAIADKISEIEISRNQEKKSNKMPTTKEKEARFRRTCDVEKTFLKVKQKALKLNANQRYFAGKGEETMRVYRSGFSNCMRNRGVLHSDSLNFIYVQLLRVRIGLERERKFVDFAQTERERGWLKREEVSYNLNFSNYFLILLS